jgi:hypothetical protein
MAIGPAHGVLDDAIELRSEPLQVKRICRHGRCVGINAAFIQC